MTFHYCLHTARMPFPLLCHTLFIYFAVVFVAQRCSAAFFEEERNGLEQRRQKVRLIQQRKMTDLTEADMKDLPDQIPLPLVIGTEVTGELVAHVFSYTGVL